MHQYGIWIKETTGTTGTGTITLTGPINGFASFASQMSAGDTVLYSIGDNGGSNRELGVGTLTSPTALARTTIRAKLVGTTFTANPSTGLNLSGSAEVAVTTDALLLEWAESIRQSTGHSGEVLVVGAGGLSGLSGTVDGGVVP